MIKYRENVIIRLKSEQHVLTTINKVNRRKNDKEMNEYGNVKSKQVRQKFDRNTLTGTQGKHLRKHLRKHSQSSQRSADLL